MDAAFSVDGITPRVVECPADPETVAQILKRAADENRAVVPRGGGTMLELGAPLQRADILLSLENLNRVLDYQPADLTVRVQAGISLAALNQTLAQNGQFVPLDPPFPDRATIGGILATNASGALRVRYGTARDWVIGMRVALADGQIAKSGGQVVKNVAGYDVAKLFIGSLGTLGVIVEAAFKVAPLPPHQATLFAAFDHMENAAAVARRILQSPVAPSALEILNRSASKALGFGQVYSLLVKFAGAPRANERQVKDVAAWSREQAALTTSVAEETEATWARLRDFLFAKETVVKIGVLPTQLAQLAARAEQITQLHRVELMSVAHAVGIAYAALEGEADNVGNAISDLRASAEQFNGHLTIQRAPRELRARVDVWGTIRSDYAIMKGLKTEFDPRGVLNPGRFREW